jgi:ERF superfamily
METSPTIKEIAKALKEWHELAITVTKDATNPHFRSKFTSLDNIIETIRAPLASCGLSFAQFPDGDGLTTILMHTSGEWLKATANLKLAKEDPQGQGSAYTYGRRYSLSAMLGLATDEDDDGNAASKPSQTAQKAATATKSGDPRKDRIKELLNVLEAPSETVGQVKLSVKSITKLELIEANYDAIITILEDRALKASNPFNHQ